MRKRIIITGASGLIATELSLQLLKMEKVDVLTLVSRNPDKLKTRYPNNNSKIRATTLEELIYNNKETYDICIHTAFSRSSSGEKLVESLEFTKKLCEWVRDQNIKTFINISSQSVYGNSYEPFIDETAPCAPEYMYALAKYSAEEIEKNIFKCSNTQLVNIRLSSVCENARFLKVFVENALANRPIVLVSPNQIVSFIDVRDVAEALIKVISSPKIIEGDYNLGSGQIYSINEISEEVRKIGKELFNIPDVKIIINDNGTKTKVGMTINKFCQTFGWHPRYSVSDMIMSLYNELTNVNGGGILRVLE